MTPQPLILLVSQLIRVAISCGFAGQPLGLLQDSSSGVLHLWSNEALHEVSMSNEDKDMWRIYLEHQVGHP